MTLTFFTGGKSTPAFGIYVKSNVLIVLTLLLFANAVFADTMEHCVLYAPLDEGSLIAIPEEATTKMLGDVDPMFSEGKKGTALVFDGEGLSAKGLSVAADNLINGEQGTIAFWMKPLVQYDQGKNKHFFFEARDTDRHAIFIDSPSQGFYFQSKVGEKWISPHFNFSWFKKPQWSSESWYHLAVTWGPDQKTVFYVNGSVIARQDGKNNIGFTPSQITIGSQYGGNKPADALMDEFYIFDVVLNADQINEVKDSL